MKALALVLILVAGCGLRASRDEHALYRSYRLATEPDARVEKGRLYLNRYPLGARASDVASVLDGLDEGYFQAHSGSVEGLEMYLLRYPSGRHVDEARQRRLALAMVRETHAGDRARRSAHTEQTLAGLHEDRRRFARRAIDYWLGVLLGVEGWGQPIEEVARANPRFHEAFATPPRPTCTERACEERYAMRFVVPVPGTSGADRELSVLVRLELREGRLEGAAIWLPGRGFSRWRELEEGVVFADADPEARAASVEWAAREVARLATEWDSSLREVPAEARGGNPNVRFTAEDGTRRLVVFAASAEDGPPAIDGVAIEPVTPPPGPAPVDVEPLDDEPAGR